MTLRLLQNLNTAFAVEDGYSALKRAITAERAARLGGLGNDVAATMRRLRAKEPDNPQRSTLVREAARLVWHYFIQRELTGMIQHDHPIAEYGIPPEVLGRLGAAE
jgi:hypothetical protein